MAALSPQADERARKNLAAIFQALSQTGQANVAKALEVSEPTVSRMKEKELPEAAKILALLQLKCVPEQYRCVDPSYLAGLEHFAKCWLEHVTVQGKATEGKALTWD
jgi:hypothetical protein